MLEYNNYSEVPPHVLDTLENECADALESFLSETTVVGDIEEDEIRVGRRVILLTLQKSVQESLAREAPKANANEDIADKTSRRETIIRDAISAVDRVITEGYDGSTEERDHLQAQVLILLATRIGIAAQRPLLQKDIEAQAESIESAIGGKAG